MRLPELVGDFRGGTQSISYVMLVAAIAVVAIPAARVLERSAVGSFDSSTIRFDKPGTYVGGDAVGHALGARDVGGGDAPGAWRVAAAARDIQPAPPPPPSVAHVKYREPCDPGARGREWCAASPEACASPAPETAAQVARDGTVTSPLGAAPSPRTRCRIVFQWLQKDAYAEEAGLGRGRFGRGWPVHTATQMLVYCDPGDGEQLFAREERSNHGTATHERDATGEIILEEVWRDQKPASWAEAQDLIAKYRDCECGTTFMNMDRLGALFGDAHVCNNDAWLETHLWAGFASGGLPAAACDSGDRVCGSPRFWASPPSFGRPACKGAGGLP